MEEKVLKSGPGVLVGVSTSKVYPKHAFFYDGDELRLIQHLDHAMPSRVEDGLTIPGHELMMFFNKSIVMYYPKGVEIDAVVD